MGTYVQHPCQSSTLTHQWQPSQQQWHQQLPGSCSTPPSPATWPLVQQPAGGPLTTLLPEAVRRGNGWRGCDPGASNQQRSRPRVQHPRQSTINMPPSQAQSACCRHCNLPRQHIPDAISNINSLYAMQSPRTCSCNVHMSDAYVQAQRMDGIILPAQLPSLTGLQHSVEYLHWRLQYSLEALQALSCLSSLSNLAYLGRQPPCSNQHCHGSSQPSTSPQQPQAAAPVMAMHPHRFQQVHQGSNCSNQALHTAEVTRASDETSRQQPGFTAPVSEGVEHMQHTQLPPWWRASGPPAMRVQADDVESCSTSSDSSSTVASLSSSSSTDAPDSRLGAASSTQHQMHTAELTLKHHTQVRAGRTGNGSPASCPVAPNASALQDAASPVAFPSLPAPVYPVVPAQLTPSTLQQLPEAVHHQVPAGPSSTAITQRLGPPVLPYPPVPLHVALPPPALQTAGASAGNTQRPMADGTVLASSLHPAGGSYTASPSMPASSGYPSAMLPCVPVHDPSPQASRYTTSTAAAAAAAASADTAIPLPLPGPLLPRMQVDNDQLTGDDVHPSQQGGHVRAALPVLHSSLDAFDSSLADSRGSTNSTDSGGTSAVPCYLGDTLDAANQPEPAVSGVDMEWAHSENSQQVLSTVTLLPAALQAGRQRQRSRFGEDTAVNDRYARRTPPQLLNMDDSARRMAEMDALATTSPVHSPGPASNTLLAAHPETSSEPQQHVSSAVLSISPMAVTQPQDLTMGLSAPDCRQASMSPSTSSTSVLQGAAGPKRVGVNSGALTNGSTLALADTASLPHPSLITSAGLPHQGNVSSASTKDPTTAAGYASNQGMVTDMDGEVLLGTMEPAAASSFPFLDPALLSLPAEHIAQPTEDTGGAVANASILSGSTSAERHQYLCRAFGLTSYDR